MRHRWLASAPPLDQSLTQHFRLAILALAGVYLVLQIMYVTRLPLVMDEFDGAREAYRLRHELPYRDFIPYKTVAGYYVQTAATFLSNDVWGRLMALKLELAIVNTLVLTAAALWMGRFIGRPGVVVALALFVACSTFLERSSELRVDMLTAWAGLWSLLLLLRGKYGYAGAAAGMSFLVSQKGAFFLVAGAAASAAMLFNDRRRLAGVMRFIVSATVVIAAYVVFWGTLTSFKSVVTATFIGGANAAIAPGYEIRAKYWTQILTRDAGYFLFTAWALWRLAAARRIAIVAYAAVLLVLAALYSQPWPYFFVLIYPTLFVLHATYFDADGLRTSLLAALLLVAVLYPGLRIFVVLHRHNDYQRYNIDLASSLLGPHDTYLAGADLVHDHEQTLPLLARLSGQPLYDLKHAPRPAVDRIIYALAAHPPLLVIGNYRIYGLPGPLLQWILDHYLRVSGSVMLYAPLSAGNVSELAFSGRYLIDSKEGRPVVIDGMAHPSGALVDLAAGPHRLGADVPVRLRLIPAALERSLDPQFVEEQNFYPNVYEY